MAFSQRMAALAAVVAIPLGIAATSYALTDEPGTPTPPKRIELESDRPAGPGSGSPTPEGTPSDEVVSPPPVDGGDDGDDDDGSGSGSGDDGKDDDTGNGNDDAGDDRGADDTGSDDDD